jgi:hypothetical protein
MELHFSKPCSTIELTKEQAEKLGIDTSQDEIRGELKTFGPWSIPVSYKALCISAVYGEYSEPQSKTIYGKRSLLNVKEDGYSLGGKVSIGGKKYRAFTSSQLFQIEGKLIDVAVIHACKVNG